VTGPSQGNFLCLSRIISPHFSSEPFTSVVPRNKLDTSQISDPRASVIASSKSAIQFWSMDRWCAAEVETLGQERTAGSDWRVERIPCLCDEGLLCIASVL
jgi:hypothetical protein